MRNTLIFTVFIITGVAFYFWNSSSDPQGNSTTEQHVSTVLDQFDSQPVHTTDIKTRSNRDALATDEEIIALWEESEKAREVLQANPEKLPGDLAGEAYIELNTQQMKSMQLGDVFELTIPQLGTSLAAEVDMVTEHPNGDKTIEANFPGMDKYYSVVFTIGAANSYAQVSTPDGVYLLEAQGDYAWITSRQSLVASHWSEHEDGVAIPETPVTDDQLNNDDIDVEFDYVIQESSSGDKP